MDESKPDLSEILSSAEQNLKRGIHTVQELAEQPGTVTAAMALAGFLTGTFIKNPEGGSKNKIEPMLVFAAGALAGLVLGRPLFRSLFRGDHIH